MEKHGDTSVHADLHAWAAQAKHGARAGLASGAVARRGGRVAEGVSLEN